MHWKAETAGITQNELDDIYNLVFGTNEYSAEREKSVVDIIRHEASECLNAGDGINLENKIVLSIAIRITAEEFMINRTNDPRS